MSDAAERKRRIMSEWLDAHPRGVLYDDSNTYAFCVSEKSTLGRDSGFMEVVEGLAVTQTSAVPVAVKVMPNVYTPPRLPHLIVHAKVPRNDHVFPPPVLRRYKHGHISVNPYADAYLDEVMDWRQGGVEEFVAKEVLFDLLCGLAACHSAGVCHGNIRPDNIALCCTSYRDDDNTTVPCSGARLCGFKRAVLVNPSNPMMTSSSRVEPGAAEFCAPEACHGGSITMFASDIGSCGLLMHHLLTGKHLISSPIPHDMTEAVDVAACLSISVPAARLLLKLCAVDPTVRGTASDALKHEWFDDCIGVQLMSATEPATLKSLRRSRRKMFETFVKPPVWTFKCSMRSKDVIGKGFHAAVYRGSWLSNDTPCAVKVMLRGGDRTREVRVLRQMPSHPNVIPVPIVTRDEYSFATLFVMPMADGFLDSAMKMRGKGLSTPVARRIFVDIVTALEHCHRHGVAHLDIKPDNVMFLNGRAVLCDFGNSQVFDKSLPPLKAVTRFFNEPRPRPYSAPELCHGGQGTYSLPYTDMWSMGALLHYLMTGAPANKHGDGRCTLSAAIDDDPLCKELIESLVPQRQEARPLCSAVLSSKWCSQPVSTQPEMESELGLVLTSSDSVSTVQQDNTAIVTVTVVTTSDAVSSTDVKCEGDETTNFNTSIVDPTVPSVPSKKRPRSDVDDEDDAGDACGSDGVALDGK